MARITFAVLCNRHLYFLRALKKLQQLKNNSPFHSPPRPCCIVVQLLSHVQLFFRPHGLQHARLPCPSLSPRLFSYSGSLNQRCHPTISSSVIPSSSCPQSFPASGSFPMSHFFSSGGQSIEVSASVLPMNIQG